MSPFWRGFLSIFADGYVDGKLASRARVFRYVLIVAAVFAAGFVIGAKVL